MEFPVCCRQGNKREQKKGFSGRSSRLMTTRFESLIFSGQGCGVAVEQMRITNMCSDCVSKRRDEEGNRSYSSKP